MRRCGTAESPTYSYSCPRHDLRPFASGVPRSIVQLSFYTLCATLGQEIVSSSSTRADNQLVGQPLRRRHPHQGTDTYSKAYKDRHLQPSGLIFSSFLSLSVSASALSTPPDARRPGSHPQHAIPRVERFRRFRSLNDHCHVYMRRVAATRVLRYTEDARV